MNLIYSDAPDTDGLTFRRLMLLGSELTFVNRPSIQMVKDFGTVAVVSGVAQIQPLFENSPIKLNVGTPPDTVFASSFYREYFEKDIKNPLFIEAVIDGVADDWFHHWLFDNNNQLNEFSDLKNWIITNRKELQATDFGSVEKPSQPFSLTTKSEAMFAFWTMLFEESLRVTAVLSIVEKFGGNPLSINPHLNKLIVLRLSDAVYNGQNIQTKSLGMRLFESMIPDEALAQLHLEDILKFREKTKDYYDAWQTEVSKIESQYLLNDINYSQVEFQKVLDQEIRPKIQEYKNEISKMRDEQFASILKTIKNVGISVIAGGTLSAMSPTAAIAAFIAANLKTPELTDDMIDGYFKMKNFKKSNGMTYLMKINELLNQ